MTYTLRLRGIIVGRSDLEHTGTTTSARSGEFRPGPGYELVEPLFQLSGERRERALRALALELLDPTGAVVPTRTIDIRDGIVHVT